MVPGDRNAREKLCVPFEQCVIEVFMEIGSEDFQVKGVLDSPSVNPLFEQSMESFNVVGSG